MFEMKVMVMVGVGLIYNCMLVRNEIVHDVYVMIVLSMVNGRKYDCRNILSFMRLRQCN